MIPSISLPSQTISENADMQREIPRLHAIMASKSKRIGELEHLVRETKEAANQEFDRLKMENEKLKQSFMAKLKEKERESECGFKEGMEEGEGGSDITLQDCHKMLQFSL